MNLKNSFLLILVIQFTKIIYSLNMDDVCSAADDICKKPNLSGVGMIEKGKCLLTGVLLRFRPMTLLDCAKKCFITSQCTSINYRQNWKLCDLVMSYDDGNEMADDSTCIRSNITTWQKSLAGQCADYNCEEGQTCEFNADGNNLKCVEAYCKSLPITPNVAVDERFGLRRNLDTGNKYKCNKGYKMKGNPFAVCQSPGHWKILFYCTTKVTVCGAEGYQYDMTTQTCIKLVKAPKSKWEAAREICQQQPDGDLVSITTKEKWDFIIKYLDEAGIGNNEKVWIGLKEGKWMNDDTFTVLDGIIDTLNRNQPCGIIKKSKSEFTSHNCQTSNMFLCEIRIA